MSLESEHICWHDFGDDPARLVLFSHVCYLWNEVVVGAGWSQLRPFGCPDVSPVEHRVLFLAQPEEIAVKHPSAMVFLALLVLAAYEDADRHALLDIEDVLILATLRRGFLLLGVAVEVQQVDVVEAAQQAFHACRGM